MTIRVIVTLGFILLATSPARCKGATTNELPLRSQCISKVVVESPAKSGQLAGFMELSIANGIPLAGYAQHDGKVIYFQFGRSCQKKNSYASSLMDAYEKKHGSVKYRVVEETVTPSTNTIELSGPYWRD